MKARNLLWIVMLNISLLLLVSVVSEYNDLTDRFEAIQNNITHSLDSAILVSMASEEFFSDDYSAMQSSLATKNDVNTVAVNNLRIYTKNKGWVTGNVYTISKFYNEKGYFPTTSFEYNTYKSSFGSTEDIYEWLFGGVGSDYHEFSWANSKTKMWNSTLWSGYKVKDREPVSEFKQFYNSIGKEMKTTINVKTKDGSYYKSNIQELPTLSLMGLKLSDYNKTSSTITNDYLSTSIHFGKTASGIADTSYFLTPYSLGVTYIPVKVLKPVFIGHLQQMVLYSKVKHTPTDTGSSADFNDGIGCISTDVYDSGHNASHLKDTSENIINDGEVEYDLNSIKVKIDYFFVDFYDNSRYEIVNRIEGSTSRYNSSGSLMPLTSSNNLQSLPYRLKLSDTSNYASGKRIVARVSVKMKIHVPYKSAVLQWFRHLSDSDGVNHYDIRLWDETNEDVDLANDGVWFTYTTYTAVTR